MAEILKPAVLATLDLIVTGRVIVSINHKQKFGYIEEFEGKVIRDPEFPDRKMLMPGVYTLFVEGCLDQFGLPTAEAHRRWNKTGIK